MTANLRRGAIEKILGKAISEAAAPFTGPSVSSVSTTGVQASSFALPWAKPSSTTGSSFGSLPTFGGIGTMFSSGAVVATSEAAGNYYLQVLFYFLLYGFVIFLVAILIHFTITPIFRFIPGGKGIIPVPGISDSLVYWNSSAQPVSEEQVPLAGDSLSSYHFENQFSFSVDLFVRKLTDTGSSKRIILYKTYSYGPSQTNPVNAPLSQTTALTDPGTIDLLTYMQARSSMVLYLTAENDIILTFFSGTTGTNYSCSPIKNIPLYTPFRIGAVIEKNIFTVYLNGMQTFQRVLPSILTMNTSNSLPTSIQKFYSAPTWASLPTQTIFVQNFILWPRAVSYGEIAEAQPALAREADFKMPAEPGVVTV
jgi:hypothetical protein